MEPNDNKSPISNSMEDNSPEYPGKKDDIYEQSKNILDKDFIKELDDFIELQINYNDLLLKRSDLQNQLNNNKKERPKRYTKKYLLLLKEGYEIRHSNLGIADAKKALSKLKKKRKSLSKKEIINADYSKWAEKNNETKKELTKNNKTIRKIKQELETNKNKLKVLLDKYSKVMTSEQQKKYAEIIKEINKKPEQQIERKTIQTVDKDGKIVEEIKEDVKEEIKEDVKEEIKLSLPSLTNKVYNYIYNKQLPISSVSDHNRCKRVAIKSQSKIYLKPNVNSLFIEQKENQSYIYVTSKIDNQFIQLVNGNWIEKKSIIIDINNQPNSESNKYEYLKELKKIREVAFNHIQFLLVQYTNASNNSKNNEFYAIISYSIENKIYNLSTSGKEYIDKITELFTIFDSIFILFTHTFINNMIKNNQLETMDRKNMYLGLDTTKKWNRRMINQKKDIKKTKFIIYIKQVINPTLRMPTGIEESQNIPIKEKYNLIVPFYRYISINEQKDNEQLVNTVKKLCVYSKIEEMKTQKLSLDSKQEGSDVDTELEGSDVESDLEGSDVESDLFGELSDESEDETEISETSKKKYEEYLKLRKINNDSKKIRQYENDKYGNKTFKEKYEEKEYIKIDKFTQLTYDNKRFKTIITDETLNINPYFYNLLHLNTEELKLFCSEYEKELRELQDDENEYHKKNNMIKNLERILKMAHDKYDKMITQIDNTPSYKNIDFHLLDESILKEIQIKTSSGRTNLVNANNVLVYSKRVKPYIDGILKNVIKKSRDKQFGRVVNEFVIPKQEAEKETKFDSKYDAKYEPKLNDSQKIVSFFNKINNMISFEVRKEELKVKAKNRQIKNAVDNNNNIEQKVETNLNWENIIEQKEEGVNGGVNGGVNNDTEIIIQEEKSEPLNQIVEEESKNSFHFGGNGEKCYACKNDIKGKIDVKTIIFNNDTKEFEPVYFCNVRCLEQIKHK